MSVTGIHHFTIRVEDQARSKGWYEQVLGFQFMDIPVSGEVTETWRGSPAEGHLFAAQIGGTFLILAPPLAGTPEGDRFSEYRIGADHIAVGVDDRTDLEQLVDSLRSAGTDTEGIELDPVLDKEYAAFRDPDNVQWEFYMAV